eukprot:TRINITY_DN9898_c0_g1_i2.p1 TRINITY_DN9898_c0_g1~~TRINITY_DN9898_c0_g1_i2.p1  ORF type:complete len:412 (+),score=114.33 TRINITY_DN9898_c0_g1_i2:327-1562(+)
MVHSLFPDLADFANIAQTADSHSATSASPTKRKATSDDAFLRSSTAPQHSILAVETPDLGGTSSKLHSRELEVEDPTLQQSIDDVDVSDDEEELLGIKPQVQRFEPTPFHASGGRSQGSKTGRRSGGRAFQDSEPLRDAVASPFPGLGSRPKSPQGATSPISDRSQVGLRHGWLRPPSKLDQIYEQDDFASPQDYAAGFRKYAPPAPSLAEPGSYMAQARRRYEREWAMELQDVDQARSGSPDVGSSSSISAKKKQQKTEVVDDMPPLKMPFVTQEGLKEIAKGHGKWKFLGRPPAKILKMKKPPDPAKVFNQKRKERRKTNLGSGLDWEEAKEKWQSWYKKNKKSRWDKVSQAASPKREDVEAEHESRMERQRKRAERFANPNFHNKGGRARDAMAPRNESFMPDWAGKD